MPSDILQRKKGIPSHDPTAVFRRLKRAGTFKMRIVRARIPLFHQPLYVARASATKMWPMGTHFWVRDNALIGERLINIELEDTRFSKQLHRQGEQLLWSSLSIMSTPSQTARFTKVIESNSDEFVNTAANWPQIFLSIESNLAGEMHEGWAHKQDAWQILALVVLRQLESGKLSTDLLSAAHKEFFSLLVPFLARVRFYQQENSGSWEELEAVRTSVIAWEMALLQQIYRLSVLQRFAFLRAGYVQYRSILTNYGDTSNFQDFVTSLLLRGAERLRSSIPFECPDYPSSDPRYREADAALIYLLQLDTPRLVAQLLDLPERWITEREHLLIKTIESLYDLRSGGYRRYKNDSYQRLGFFRPTIAQKLAEMYGSPSGDASAGFTGRDKIVPKGPEAAWSHFTWQLVAWSGRRFRETNDAKYMKMQQRYFQRALRTITHKGEKSVELSSKGRLRTKPIQAYQIPECYLTEEDKNGDHYLFPSPHTPLNWATAEALSAFASLINVTKRQAKIR